MVDVAREWQEIGAPYEVAHARLLLVIGFRGQGDEHAATLELQAALTTFERPGAKLDGGAREGAARASRRVGPFSSRTSSTRRKRLETLGDERWRKLLAQHDTLVRPRIGESGGEVIKQTGDGFFASFDEPRAAVAAAVAIQRALQSEVFAPNVRIGAHAGSAFKTGASFTDYAREERARRRPNRCGRSCGRGAGQPGDA